MRDAERFQDASHDPTHSLTREERQVLVSRWMEEYGHRILATIQRFIGRYEDSEDGTQEVWSKVDACLCKGELPSAIWAEVQNCLSCLGVGEIPLPSALLGAWLRKIAVNVAIDFLRKRRGEKRCRKPFEETGEYYSALEPAVEHAREATERMIEALLAAVASLDPSLKIVVECRLAGGTLVELAALLRVPINCVGRRRVRAFKLLGHALQPLRQELEDLGVEFLPRKLSPKKKNRSS